MPTRPFAVFRAVPGVLIALAGSTSALAVGPFGTSVDLSAVINGTDGFVMNSVDFYDHGGFAVSGAGDVNGDGFGDLIIGAWAADPGGNSSAGETYIVFGGPAVAPLGSIELSALNGTNGYVLTGIGADDRSGFSVAGAGDINGDGVDDLIIGAYQAQPGGKNKAGEAYIVFGGAAVGASGSINLATLNGTTGFRVPGIDAFDRCGSSVAPAGDLNGDGIDDILIGARGASPALQGLAGETYILFGKDTGTVGNFPASFDLTTLNGTNGYVINGIGLGDMSGFSVASAGDINGDGAVDIVIGAYSADPAGKNQAGEAYVVFGGAGVGAAGSINLSALNGATGFKMSGIDASDRCGFSVASAGDLNGDGIDEVIIGAYAADPNSNSASGECYVIFGKNTSIAGNFTATIDLTALSGANGFMVTGADKFDFAGKSVSPAGDIDNDGYDDVFIGAPGGDPNAQSAAGESYVLLGNPTIGSTGLFNLSAIDGTNGFVINGIAPLDESGISVSNTTDVNGDGLTDLIIGARNSSPGGRTNAGTSYVVFGRSSAPACAGDINGDGFTNAADFTILAGNFGSAVAPNTGGDLNGDGLVNAGDFVILAGDFGCGS